MITRFTSIAKKLPSPLYKILALNYIDTKYPRHLFIETTANCNLSCSFCPREKRQENMDYALFKEIIDEAKQYGARSFSLHLFGEPLLYPQILQSIEYIKKSNRRNTVLLTTNGTLLNGFINDLVKLKVDKIIWTWRRNHFTDNTKKLLKKIGLIRFIVEETPEGEMERWNGFEREIKYLHNYGGNIKVTKEPEKRWPCYHLWLAPAIRWNGEIVECCNLPKSGEDVLGKYGEVNMHEAWNCLMITYLRQSHLKGIYPGKCASCNSYQAYPNIFFGHEYLANKS